MLASVASMIDKFNMNNINILRDMGYSVDVAANFDFGSITSQERVDEFKQELIDDGIRVFNIQIPRRITDIKGIINSYKKVIQLADSENYELMHCHSPIGGVIARLAFRKARKKGTKVIYTAHGFHFFKGASLFNWLIYFPAEWFCSLFTDVLITINKEDYEISKKYMKAKAVKYTHGIGVDTIKFENTYCNKDEKRREIGVSKDSIMLFSVGELNENKNHELIIKAILECKDLKLHYCIAGEGNKRSYLENLVIENGISDKVTFLGYRKDINELLSINDIFCFPSLREGLPVSLMEAMAAGLPVVCSNIRGNTDLIKDDEGGFLCSINDVDDFSEKIKILSQDKELREKMKKANLRNIKKFDINNVNLEMKDIYLRIKKEVEKENSI